VGDEDEDQIELRRVEGEGRGSNEQRDEQKNGSLHRDFRITYKGTKVISIVAL